MKYVVGLLPDTHVPFHDKLAYKLCLKVFKHLKINELVLKGDFADFYTMNMHEKSLDPRIKYTFVDELNAVWKELDNIENMFPKAKLVYVEGNHENRATRKIRKVMPEMLGAHFVSMESLLQLDNRWEFIPFTQDQMYKPFKEYGVRHCPISTSVNPKKAMEDVLFSYNHGHDHKIYKMTKRVITGEKIEVSSDGWLGDKDHIVFKYTTKTPSWSLGFSYLIKDEKNIDLKQVEIFQDEKKYYCYIGDKLFYVKK